MEHPLDITHENYLEAIKNPDFTPEKFNIKQILEERKNKKPTPAPKPE